MATQTEQFVEKVVKLPLGQKLAVIGFIAAAVTAANYFLLVSPTLDKSEAALKRMRQLESEVIQNQAIANNLAQYRKEKERLEQQLQKALTELPQEARLEDLIQSLYEIGEKSGLTIVAIEPKGENRAGFYAQVPVAMAVRGSFHEIGVFLDSISKLKRIVNITNIRMGGPKPKNERIIVDATYTATAFRFLPQSSQADESNAKKKGAKK